MSKHKPAERWAHLPEWKGGYGPSGQDDDMRPTVKKIKRKKARAALAPETGR